jgi:DNA transposition AAA+ family ATPase
MNVPEAVRTRFETFLEEHPEVTIREVGRAISKSPVTISMWRNDKYKGNNEAVTTAINNFMERYAGRQRVRKDKFVDTSISELFFDIASVCHNLGRMGMAVGLSGVGKTMAAKEYKRQNKDTILIEAASVVSEKGILEKLHRAAGGDGRGNKGELFEGICEQLKDSQRLIIVDEAEHLLDKVLEHFRRIYDFTGVGVLYVGLPKFAAMIINMKRDFDYIQNRIYVPAKLGQITVEDARAILQTIIPNVNGHAETFQQLSKGRARKMVFLAEECLRLMQLNNKELSDSFIHSVDRAMRLEGMAHV